MKLENEVSPSPAPKRGRPVTGTAMTNAEKQRAYRERKKAREAELRDPDVPLSSKVIDLSELPAWKRK